MEYKAQQTDKKLLPLIKGSITILIGAIILISVIAPYVHIFFSRDSAVKVFGFNNMRNFLYAIGLPCSLFVLSSTMLYISKYQREKFVKFLTEFISVIFLCSSIFQFFWIFIPQEDLPLSSYYFTIIIYSTSTTISFFLLFKKRKSLIDKLQKTVNALSVFSFIDAKKYVEKDNLEEYNKELYTKLNEEVTK